MSARSVGRPVALLVELLVFGSAYVASRPERRRLLDALQTADATSSETAMTTYQLGAEQSRVMARLVRGGLVAQTPDGRFYITDWERTRASNRVSIAMGIGAGLLGLAAAVGLVWIATL